MSDDSPEKLGRYEIIRIIGKGAMGVVYEGRDPFIGRRVAIKTCRRDVMEASNLKEEMLQRFDRELRAAGALQHPNIVTIYDVGEDQGLPYIAMEYIEGHDLRHVIEHRVDYDVAVILELMARVCEGLHHAHLHGVIHRDIKPANILVPARGGVKLADFGIARTADSELTLDGAIVGTPHYMSPEQFTGETLDGRSDLFSVGIILYELLTGEKPFAGEALSTVMHHVLKRDPVPPSQRNPALKSTVDTVVLKSLAKSPNARYVDGNAMAAALRECLKREPDMEIVEGAAPNKATTVLGGPRPQKPEPEPEPAAEAPMASSQQSTIMRATAQSLRDDHTSTMLWPVIAVGLFTALIIIAVALRMQVNTPTGTEPPAAGQTVVNQPLRLEPVWGADSEDTLAIVNSASSAEKLGELLAKQPETLRAQLRPISAKVRVLDNAGGRLIAEVSLDADAPPFVVPVSVPALRLEISAEDYETRSLLVNRSADGTWSLPPVGLLRKKPAGAPA